MKNVKHLKKKNAITMFLINSFRTRRDIEGNNNTLLLRTI